MDLQNSVLQFIEKHESGIALLDIVMAFKEEGDIKPVMDAIRELDESGRIILDGGLYFYVFGLNNE